MALFQNRRVALPVFDEEVIYAGHLYSSVILFANFLVTDQCAVRFDKDIGAWFDKLY